MDKNIMEYETVDLDEESGSVVILDQTKLPGKAELIKLQDRKSVV